MTLLGDKDVVLCTHGGRLNLQASKGKAIGALAFNKGDLLNTAIASWSITWLVQPIPCSKIVAVG